MKKNLNHVLKITFSILFVICILAVTGCNTKETKKEEAPEQAVPENSTILTDAQIKNAGVQIGKIEQRQISSTIKVNGKIDVPPQNLVSISVPMGGYLKTTNLLFGKTRIIFRPIRIWVTLNCCRAIGWKLLNYTQKLKSSTQTMNLFY